MPDFIGGIEVPEITPNGVFPVVPDRGWRRAHAPQVAIHQFGSGNTKVEQRYYLGSGAKRFTVGKADMNELDRVALRDFWEARQGGFGSFTYQYPLEDASGTENFTVRFANVPLSWEHLSDSLSRADVELIEIPSTNPSYTLNATQTRYPSGGLPAALLAQPQEIIPLIKIRVLDSGYPDIFLSDRRCIVGGQQYLARLLSFEGIKQFMGEQSDHATFTFGNADRVMSELANDTDLQRAVIEFSLFHVGTGIKLDLWSGDLATYNSHAGEVFPVEASDRYGQTLSYPPRRLDPPCGWDFDDGNNCPFTAEGALDLTNFPAADAGSCDKGYTTDNGCLAHGMKHFFGGIIAEPQGILVKIRDPKIKIAQTSLINESIFEQVLQEIYTDSDMPVSCAIAAGREEGEFYRALGIVGAGVLTYNLTHPDRFLLDGAPNHGPGLAGIRFAQGFHPALAGDYFTLAQKGPFNDLPAWRQAQVGALHFKDNFAAGVAFVEMLRADPPGIQLSRPEQHEMVVRIATGLQGWVWTDSGDHVNFTRSLEVLTNPFWICVNAHLKALGLQFADSATQMQHFDVQAVADSTLVTGFPKGAALIADLTVDKLVGTGTETQFKFRGIIGKRKPLRDWMRDILLNCQGYYIFSFGKLRLGIRTNSSVVEAFTEGNILFNSLELSPLQPRFNYLTARFADAELGFDATPPAVLYDIDHAKRLGGGQPEYLTGEINLAGCASRSQAHRLLIANLREELGGMDEAEQKAARNGRYLTTILALNVEPGMVCSLTHPDMPNGAGEFRVLGWILNDDYSIEVVWRTTTDAMYDATVGPKPEDVLPDPVPTEIDRTTVPFPWSPAMRRNPASTATTLRKITDYSFGIAQRYQVNADGTATGVIQVGGRLPVNRISTEIQRPRISLDVSTATTGGFLEPGTYYIAVSAVDDGTYPDAGLQTLLSDIAEIEIPAGTSTNTVTISVTKWDPATAGWMLYFGRRSNRLSSQPGAVYLVSLGGAVTVTGTEAQPATITFKGINDPANLPDGFFEHYAGAPDQWFRKLKFTAQEGLHLGIWGGDVVSTTPTTITLGVDPPFTTNALAGRYVSLMGKRNTSLDLDETGGMALADFLIASNDGDTLTLAAGQVDPATVGMEPLDAVVIRTKVTAVGADYIEDSQSGQGGQGLGEGGDDSLAGFLVLGIAGAGAGEQRVITANDATANRIHLEGENPFDTTSIFVVIAATAALEHITDTLSTGRNDTFLSIPINAANLVRAQYVVRAVAVSASGAESPFLESPYRELMVYGISVEDSQVVSFFFRDNENDGHLSIKQPDGTLLDLETGIGGIGFGRIFAHLQPGADYSQKVNAAYAVAVTQGSGIIDAYSLSGAQVGSETILFDNPAIPVVLLMGETILTPTGDFDTIRIEDGVNVAIIGAGIGHTVVKGNGATRACIRAVGACDGIDVKDLTVDADSLAKYGVKIEDAVINWSVERVEATGTTGTNADGIAAEGVTTWVERGKIIDCKVHDFSTAGTGISTRRVRDVEIAGNHVYGNGGNTFAGQGAIGLSGFRQKVHHNTIRSADSATSFSLGISSFRSMETEICNNHIEDTGATIFIGIWSDTDYGGAIHDNTVFGCLYGIESECSPYTAVHHNELIRTREKSILIKGRLGTDDTLLHDCETNWTASANVTSSLDAADKQVGANSVKLEIASGFTTGVVAYADIGPIDISLHMYIRMWIKSDVEILNGVFSLRLTDAVALGGNVILNTDIPKLHANTWQQIYIPLRAYWSTLTAVRSIGIIGAADPGTVTLRIDDVQAETIAWKIPVSDNVLKDCACFGGIHVQQSVQQCDIEQNQIHEVGRFTAAAMSGATGIWLEEDTSQIHVVGNRIRSEYSGAGENNQVGIDNRGTDNHIRDNKIYGFPSGQEIDNSLATRPRCWGNEFLFTDGIFRTQFLEMQFLADNESVDGRIGAKDVFEVGEHFGIGTVGDYPLRLYTNSVRRLEIGAGILAGLIHATGGQFRSTSGAVVGEFGADAFALGVVAIGSVSNSDVAFYRDTSNLQAIFNSDGFKVMVSMDLDTGELHADRASDAEHFRLHVGGTEKLQVTTGGLVHAMEGQFRSTESAIVSEFGSEAFAASIAAFGTVSAHDVGIYRGSSRRVLVRDTDVLFDVGLTPSATGHDFGAASARWDAFLEAGKVYASLNLDYATASKPLFTDASKNVVSQDIDIGASYVTGNVPISRGGTGATTAADARTALSVYSTSQVDTLLNAKADAVSITGDTIPLAKITPGGADGSIQVNGQGVVQAFVKPT